MTARQIVVDFAGEGEGTEELSWGQREIWQAMVDQKSALPIGGTQPRSGISVDTVAEELRYLMSRFQTMRTRLSFADDGRPLQSLSAKGRIVLEVFEAGEDDPVDLARRVYAEYAGKPFDFVHDWPVRMAVVCRHGIPVQQIGVLTHLTTDFHGGAIMVDEVNRGVETPVDGMQPLEQARWQQSPAGMRHNEAALRYFARQLDRIPLAMLTDDSGAARHPRYRKVKLRSEALWLAVRALAERTGVDSSAIVLALYAIGYTRATGGSTFFTRPVVNNRFRPRLSNVVCMLAQASLCVIQTGAKTVDEVIRHTQQAAMTAYKHAYFDPRRLSTLIAETAQRRGPSFSVSCFFNDRRADTRLEPADDVNRIEQALPKTKIYFVPEPEKICDRLFLNVEDVSGLIELTVDFDAHYVSPLTTDAMLRAMEEVAVAAADDPNYKA